MLGNFLSDLWSYNITNREWNWLSGVSTVNSAGVYGSKGIPSTANYPRARSAHGMAFNSNLNSIYVFGGNSISSSLICISINDSSLIRCYFE